jgi:hypothetical protein
MDRQDEIARGQWAEQLLKDPRWIEAWEAFRLAVFAKMENAKTDEGTLRGKDYLRVANDVRAYFEGHIRTGHMAANEIKLEEEEKRKKHFWSRAA